jgi:hypothetical protein
MPLASFYEIHSYYITYLRGFTTPQNGTLLIGDLEISCLYRATFQPDIKDPHSHTSLSELGIAKNLAEATLNF